MKFSKTRQPQLPPPEARSHTLWMWLLFCFIPTLAIDLLAALNTSHRISGVTRLQSSEGVTYRIRPRAPYLTLPTEYSHYLHANLQGSMGVHLAGHQSSGSSATLLSLSSASLSILQISSSTLNNTLRLDYQSRGEAWGPASILFPRKNPFSSEQWVQLAVSLEPDRLVFYVDCQEAVVVPLKGEERIDLDLPKGVVVTLAGTPGKKDSKFNVSHCTSVRLLYNFGNMRTHLLSFI